MYLPGSACSSQANPALTKLYMYVGNLFIYLFIQCDNPRVAGSKLDPDQKHEDGRNEVQVYCSKAKSK